MTYYINQHNLSLLMKMMLANTDGDRLGAAKAGPTAVLRWIQASAGACGVQICVLILRVSQK